VIDWLSLVLLPGLGSLGRKRLLDTFGDPGEIAHRVPLAAIAEVGRLGARRKEAVREARQGLERRARRELKMARNLGVLLLPCDAPGFPRQLLEIADPPPLLYVRGKLDTATLTVAVVGSRNCTAYGARIAGGLGQGLADHGIEVVSGGARGVDGRAHRGALDAGGRTLAVVGSGLLSPYPTEHRGLFDEIARNGAVLSEMALERPPHPANFPRRNRLISGLARVVVVVEAARRSGSLSTASHALDQGRDVLAVPGPVSSSRSVGCHRLIQQGAKLVQNIEDILNELPGRPASKKARNPGPAPGSGGAGLTPDETAVLELLDEVEPVQVDSLADRVPFGVARLQAALFGLEVRGAVDRSAGRYYLLRPRAEG
jgi:DNA processing protein